MRSESLATRLPSTYTSLHSHLILVSLVPNVVWQLAYSKRVRVYLTSSLHHQLINSYCLHITGQISPSSLHAQISSVMR